MQPDRAEIKSSIDRVRDGIAAAARRAGRAPGDVTLVAITKTVPAETVALAAELRVTEMGENRVQEASSKIPLLPSGLVWHMVGRLQTNKIRDAIGLFSLIHSVDRLNLAEGLSRAAETRGEPCRALVQVSVTGSPAQGGVEPSRAEELIEKCLGLHYLRIVGLMAIGPYPASEGEIRSAYREAGALFRRLAAASGPEFRVLSLGMSGDYGIAVEEGSTLVRVGTAIFGERRST